MTTSNHVVCILKTLSLAEMVWCGRVKPQSTHSGDFEPPRSLSPFASFPDRLSTPPSSVISRTR